MNRYEAIDLSFRIKADPETHRPEFANYLYEAVGMVKLEKDSGATFAAKKLADTILTASDGNLSAFCKRKVDIIEKAYMQNILHGFEALARAQYIADYNAEIAMMQAQERRYSEEQDMLEEGVW